MHQFARVSIRTRFRQILGSPLERPRPPQPVGPPDEAFLHHARLAAQADVGVSLGLQLVLVLGLDVDDLAVCVLLDLHLHLLVGALLLERLLARLLEQGGLLGQPVLVAGRLGGQLGPGRFRLVGQPPAVEAHGTCLLLHTIIWQLSGHMCPSHKFKGQLHGVKKLKGNNDFQFLTNLFGIVHRIAVTEYRTCR